MSVPESILRNTCVELYPSEAQFSATEELSLETAREIAAKRLELLWPIGAKITLNLPHSTLGWTARANKIRQAADSLEEYASVTFDLQAEAEGPDIEVFFDRRGGNTAPSGTSSSRSRMNLPCVTTAENVDDDEEELFSIVHQLGHVLGMTHEHPAHMRLDEKVTARIYRDVHHWNAERVRSEVLDIYNTGGAVTNFVRYDNRSFMRTPLTAEQTTTGQALRLNTRLSEQDKAWLTIHYPSSLQDPYRGMKLEYALQVAGVPPELRQRMSELDGDELRRQYSEWWTERIVETRKSCHVS